MRRALAALVLAVALPLPGLADLVVQPGETLSEIAERNGVGLQQLMRANGIENPKLVQAGQRLLLPGGATATASRSRGGRTNGGPNGGSKTGAVVVQPGETLSEIAERNGVGLQQLMRANGIENPKLVQAGQRLLLPGGATATASRSRGSRDAGAAAPGASGRSFSYSVKEGETLSEIAERYDTTVNQLMQRNRIGDPSQLQAGSKLFIPGTQVTAPNSGTSRAATTKPAEQAYNPKAKEHVVQSGESLSQIADGYKMPLDKLVVINNISNPDLVLSGTRLKLTAPPPVTTAKPSNPVKPNRSASQVAAKPAPAKPAASKAKATTAASTAQSFPAAPTNKPRITPSPVATSPAFGQGQPSRPTSSPVITNAAGGAISGKPTTDKPTTAKASQAPITTAGQSAAKTATATANTNTNTTATATDTANTNTAATGTSNTNANANITGTATSTRPAAKATIASTAAATTATSMANSAAGPVNSANPKPEKSNPITANPAARISSTASGSALNSSTLNSTARNSAAMNGSTPNNSAANTAAANASAANASARGAAGKASGQSAAAATTAKIATTDSGAATAGTGAVSSRAPGGSKPLDSAKTAKTIAPDWRTYGPVSVDWANWQSMGGSYVAPSLNGEGQPLYTAINCGARKLNSTSQSGQWKTWEGPRSDAEQQLVNDLCKAKGG